MSGVVFVFPGMGKTPAAKQCARLLDLDFGHYREAMRVPKERENVLLPSFLNLIHQYVNEDWVILTNEYKLMVGVSKMYGGHTHHIRVFLPKDPTRSAEKLGLTVEETEAAIAKWEKKARRIGVGPKYLDTSFDEYVLHHGLDKRLMR